MNEGMAIPGARRILVVDDDRVILKMLSTFLTANGFQVITAADGSEAASSVAKEKPDLILLDLLFPPDAMNVGGALQDGFYIIQWLRRMGHAETIPIIIISADHSEKDRQRVLDAGAVAFFPKPIDRNALLAAIHTTLGTKTPDAMPAAA
jgi:adenylate cyclase